eukprot:6194961-Pleurochrysis_carterae.AAC.1
MRVKFRRNARLRDRYQSFRPGGQEPTINYKIEVVGGCEQAQVRGLGRTCAVALGQGTLRLGLPWAQRGLQNLKSGARARREYACDANANWETMHVSVELHMRSARDDSL